jgi:hypothetical protein
MLKFDKIINQMKTVMTIFKNSIIKGSYFLLFFFAFGGYAQIFTDSNLPIVIITTDINPDTNQPYEIPDEPRVLGSMKIIKHPDGSRNYMSDSNTTAFLNYDGRINIEIRGSSSQALPKKPYGLTTLKPDNVSNNNVSLLGMPSENDWILNSLAFDPSLIRDYLSYAISRQIGNYAPRTVYCEVVINGEYIGLYLLQEKIKADSNRVNILKITTTDTALPNVTGGYITKADKTTGDDPIAWSMQSYAGITDYIHDLPKPENVTPQQNFYIYNQFSLLENTSAAGNIAITNGYPSVIDIPTFLDFMLSNELASNVDGYQYSTYFHKERAGKLRAGPIWDFNLTYGNDLFLWGYDRSKTNVWQFDNEDNVGSKFWKDLFNNSIFKCYLSKRWNELKQPGKAMNLTTLNTFIDETVTYINEAKIRENQKWGTIPNQELEIGNLKSFLALRSTWITNNIGSFSACSSVSTPPLVITKINYNPSTSTEYPESNDSEFIEIKNTGLQNVLLSGIYFKELGISYSFPVGSTILQGQSIYIASNPDVFLARYGISAFGQFTRNLSNKSQKLVLADAFGNTIDYVEYMDSSPWPTLADGNGYYLQLISTDLDNSLASSWTTTVDQSLSSIEYTFTSDLKIYPNPVNSILNVQATQSITKIEIFDVFGKKLQTIIDDSALIHLKMDSYTKGIYFIKIYGEEKSFKVEKVIKK